MTAEQFFTVVVALVVVGCIANDPETNGNVYADAGGHRLELRIEGSGTPTVVLEAGSGGGIDSWAAVQRSLAGRTRVAAYNRAGTGRSDRGPTPRSALRIADELHLALDHAGLEPPYILVGHSIGGSYIRVFAARYPDEVVGLVLVDPTLEGPTERSMDEILATLRLQWPDHHRRIERILDDTHVALAWLAAESLLGLDPYLTQLSDEHRDIDRKVLLEWWIALTRRIEGSFPLMARSARDEFFASGETLAQARAAVNANVPITLIAALSSNGAPEVDSDVMRRFVEWESNQRLVRVREWLDRHPNARLIVAEDADHNIPTNNPGYIIDSVTEMLTAER